MPRAICILFVALVNVRRWSPNDAEWPFTIMGGVYALFATAAAACGRGDSTRPRSAMAAAAGGWGKAVGS